MSALLKRLLKESTNALLERKHVKHFKLTQEEYLELCRESFFQIDPDPPPEPPIEAKAHWSSGGIFSSSSGSYEKRDYHAPEYLEAKAAWRKRMSDPNRDKRPRLWGTPIEVIT